MAHADKRINFPPGRIVDLKAESIESGILITFTAPGGDLDEGKGPF